jgi:hypothetical protein
VAALLSIAAVAATAPLSANANSGATSTDLGINVLIYPQYGTLQQNLTAAQHTFEYAKSLNANSVSLNFFMYQATYTSSTVSAGAATPSVSLLGAMVDLAHADGLRVQLRPQLNEDSLHAEGQWRGSIVPSNMTEWFASYLTFLKPYMIMARVHHVEEFAIGVELASLSHYDQYWVPILEDAQQLTGSKVIYESNWNGQTSLDGPAFGLDFYQPVTGISSDSDATVANLTAGMESNLAGTYYDALQFPPSQTILTEVGLAASSGSYNNPWVYPSPPDSSLDRTLQANWFTAACDTVQQLGMGGIYYWFLPISAGNNAQTYNADSALDPVQWENTATSAAISSCFNPSNW